MGSWVYLGKLGTCGVPGGCGGHALCGCHGNHYDSPAMLEKAVVMMESWGNVQTKPWGDGVVSWASRGGWVVKICRRMVMEELMREVVQVGDGRVEVVVAGGEVHVHVGERSLVDLSGEPGVGLGELVR